MLAAYEKNGYLLKPLTEANILITHNQLLEATKKQKQTFNYLSYHIKLGFFMTANLPFKA